eukprot:gene6089-6706_t
MIPSSSSSSSAGLMPGYQKDCQEITLLLQQALLKHYQQQKLVAKRSRAAVLAATATTSGEEGEEDFVIDLYTCGGEEAEVEQATTSVKEEQEEEEDAIPRVRVNGLRFLSSGQVEEVLVYDSDWSDLAEDEDCDSNDERYEGNDYPEDEDEEDYFAGRQEEEEGSYDDDDDEEQEETRHQFRHRQAQIRRKVAQVNERGGGGGSTLYDDLDEDLEIDHDDQEPLLSQLRRIGRVLPREDHPDSAALQHLWDLSSSSTTATTTTPGLPLYQQQDHVQRLQAMRERTGMVFGARLEEFTSSGLAKYGAELDSEVEVEVEVELADGLTLPRDTVAYDSELDHDP